MTNAPDPRVRGAVVTRRPASLDTHDTAPHPQVPDALAPEPALIACLLNADRATAAGILGAICDADVGDYRLQAVLTLARRVVDAGRPPEPGILLATARAGGITSATHDLGLLLADLAGSVTVVASWRYYLAAVVEDAIRRRAAEAGARIAQAVGHDSIDTVLDLVVSEASEVHAVAARRVTDRRPPTPLRAVQ